MKFPPLNMIDFTQQLTDYDGKPSKQGEKSTDPKTGKVKIVQKPLTLRRCAYFALLDIAQLPGGLSHELNNAHSYQKRYHLMKKIDESPEKVEMTKEERDFLLVLLPLRFDVIIVGQIMDIFDKEE